MATVKLDHANLTQHSMQQYREIWKEGQLCDVVIKSSDGQIHRAHGVVLAAASTVLKKLLIGSFREADQVKLGEAIEIAASSTVVSVLLDYIYHGQPEMTVEDSLELLRLADAYDLPNLTAAVEAGLHTCVDEGEVDTALRILKQTNSSPRLQAACEVKVAANFEECAKCPEFLKLSATNLGRILERKDLKVTYEDEVLKAVLKWFSGAAEKITDIFGLLLRHVDFPSISSENLAQIDQLSPSLGPPGDELHREVQQAMRLQRKRSMRSSVSDEEEPDFWPKRKCFRTMYIADGKTIFAWKPDVQAKPQAVAGEGAAVNGINDFSDCGMAVLPQGELLVADVGHQRLLNFQNGCGKLVLDDVAGLTNVFCSPNGAVYVLTDRGKAVHKLVDATLQPSIVSENLPEDLQFQSSYLFVTEDESLYVSDFKNARVLRLRAGENVPAVVGRVPNKQGSWLCGLFVTQAGTVYVADAGLKKVWAFPADTTTCVQVVDVFPSLPYTVLVQDQSFYVGVGDSNAAPWRKDVGLYEYPISPKFQLE